MSKEELLKYLIAEIDLIIHDKDYRFENEDGTWYSRESCRDLTNEEVFEELKTELRQLTDLEAKVAESEEQLNSAQVGEKFALKCCDEAKQQLAEAEEHIDNLELKLREQYQLVDEKDKEIENMKLCKCVPCKMECDYMLEGLVSDLEKELDKADQDKISFAVEQLEKVKELAHNHIKEIANDLSEEDDERLNQKHTIHGLATAITDIDNQIKQLKEMK